MAKSKVPSYPVGYQKPPRETQFKPGQSGNPNGRPKKTVTFQDALRKELLAPVTVLQEDGKRKKISGLVIMLRRLLNNAAKGDFKSTKLVSELTQILQDSGASRLDELVRTMREGHALLEDTYRNRTRRRNKPGVGGRKDASGSSAPGEDSQ